MALLFGDDVDDDTVVKQLTDDLNNEIITAIVDVGSRLDVESDAVDVASERATEEQVETHAIKFDSSSEDENDEPGDTEEQVSDSEKTGRWTFSKGAAKKGAKKSKKADLIDGNFDSLKAKKAPTKKEQEALVSENQRLARSTEIKFPYRNSEQKPFADFLRSRNSTFAKTVLAQLEREEQQKQAKLAAKQKQADAKKSAEEGRNNLQKHDGSDAAHAIVVDSVPANVHDDKGAGEADIQEIPAATDSEIARSEPGETAEVGVQEQQQQQQQSKPEATDIGELNLTVITRWDESTAGAMSRIEADGEEEGMLLFDDTIVVHDRAFSTPQRTATQRLRIAPTSQAIASAIAMQEQAKKEADVPSVFNAPGNGQRLSLRALKQRALQQQQGTGGGEGAAARLPKIDENVEVIEIEVAETGTAKAVENAKSSDIESFKKRVVLGTLPEARSTSEANPDSEAAGVAKKLMLRDLLETEMARQREGARRERERAYKLENEERLGEAEGAESGSEPDAAELDEDEEEDEEEEGETESEPSGDDGDEVIPLEKLGVANDNDEEAEDAEANCEFVDKEASESSGSEESDGDVIEADSEFGDEAMSTSQRRSKLDETSETEESHDEGGSEKDSPTKREKRKRVQCYISDSELDDASQPNVNQEPIQLCDADADIDMQRKIVDNGERGITRAVTAASSVSELQTQLSMFVVDADGFVIPKSRERNNTDAEDDGSESDAPIGGLTQLLGDEVRHESEADSGTECSSLRLASAIQFCSGQFAEPRRERKAVDKAESSSIKSAVELDLGESETSKPVAAPVNSSISRLETDSDADDEEDVVASRKQKKRKHRVVVDEDDVDEVVAAEEVEVRKSKRLDISGSDADKDELEKSAVLDEQSGAGNDASKDEDAEARDEDVGENEKRKKFRGFRSSRTGRLRNDFVDEEAQLTSSDESAVSSDEDERELVEQLLAEEQNENQRVRFVDDNQLDADDSVPRDENELRRQVERIHLKRAIDDDQRDVRFFKEKFLHDADHEDSFGPGRTRLFRWRGLMNPDAENWVMSDSEHEEEADETVLATGGFDWNAIRNRMGEKFAANTTDSSGPSATKSGEDNTNTNSNVMKRSATDDGRVRAPGSERKDDAVETDSGPKEYGRAKRHSADDSSDGAMLEHLYDKYSANSSFLRRTFRVLHERTGALRRSASVYASAAADQDQGTKTPATANAGGAQHSSRLVGNLNDMNPLDRAKAIGRSIMRQASSSASLDAEAVKKPDAAAGSKNDNNNEPGKGNRVTAFNRKRGLFAMTSPAAPKFAEPEAKKARGVDEHQSARGFGAGASEEQSLGPSSASAGIHRSLSTPATRDLFAPSEQPPKAIARQGSVFAFLK